MDGRTKNALGVSVSVASFEGTSETSLLFDHLLLSLGSVEVGSKLNDFKGHLGGRVKGCL